MEAIQFIQYSPEQLQNEIKAGVKVQLDDFLKHYKPKEPNEYLTRQEVAKMFNVDLSTIHNWCKSKKLNPLGLGARVYFLRSEIEQSLKPLNV
ncbi:helix-turn-helix domain-containing protein [Flavobacterium psychrophilum]|uniref:helix-turn-helix domain-containing protein n=1 Tax=Flavobacterium psychrophilum TaxID=96345 RepID=UPI002A46A9E3|nr:helix-turn-helix domain-containing protein [Flavobacterium psychrophilum]EKT3966452.1 helix-turn-helix domain-containing protein [Flavobacterium psychrophilum]EKT4518365.1 helix-turn-helix domain-containing protein [Flavobacterium psychrophilum]